MRDHLFFNATEAKVAVLEAPQQGATPNPPQYKAKVWKKHDMIELVGDACARLSCGTRKLCKQFDGAKSTLDEIEEVQWPAFRRMCLKLIDDHETSALSANPELTGEPPCDDRGDMGPEDDEDEDDEEEKPRKTKKKAAPPAAAHGQAWHLGPPPHAGDWLTQRSGGSVSRIRQWNGKHWSYGWHQTKNAAEDIAAYRTRSAPAQGQIRWWGHQADAEGWIKWSGGDAPITTSEMVFYRMRGGRKGVDPASSLRWNHLGHCADIIAYRPTVDPGGLTWHDGERCPLAQGTIVKVRTRGGEVKEVVAGSLLYFANWTHTQTPEDVMAYCPLPAAVPKEA